MLGLAAFKADDNDDDDDNVAVDSGRGTTNPLARLLDDTARSKRRKAEREEKDCILIILYRVFCICLLLIFIT